MAVGGGSAATGRSVAAFETVSAAGLVAGAGGRHLVGQARREADDAPRAAEAGPAMVEGTSVVPEDMLPQPAARLKLPAEEQRRRTFFPRASADPTP